VLNDSETLAEVDQLTDSDSEIKIDSLVETEILNDSETDSEVLNDAEIDPETLSDADWLTDSD